MIIYGQESYKIIGAAFDVYNKLGHGFLEAVYQECLEIEFKKGGIPYEREKDIKSFTMVLSYNNLTEQTLFALIRLS